MNNIRKLQRTSARSDRYEPGRCHVCHQRNVMIRKLWCEKHNYCRSCAEIIPRLLFGDFRCQRCPKKDQIDPFLASPAAEYASRKYRSKRSKNIIDSDDSDNNDLEGNNQSLDKLLESLIEPAILEKPSPTEENREEFKPIPRKLSFLHLTLPSANSDVTEKKKTPKPSFICNTVTQILNSQESSKFRSHHAESKSRSSNDNHHNPPSLSQQKGQNGPQTNKLAPLRQEKFSLFKKFEPDPPELERNTSPCKGVRPRSCQSGNSLNSHRSTSSESETDQLLQLIGDIDGPEFPSSSSSRSASGASVKPYDDFWD